MSRRVQIRRKAKAKMRPRTVLYAAVILTIACGALLGEVSITCAATRCENEAVRSEQHATFLPNCRAYELVSAPGVVPKFAEVLENGVAKGGIAIENAMAARDGDRLSFASYYPAEGSSQADGFYLSSRGANGWESETVTPPMSTSARTGCSASVLFSAELTGYVLSDGGNQTQEPYCGHNEPALVTGEPAGWRNEAELAFKNVFLRESVGVAAHYSLVNRTPTTASPSNATLQAVSQDLSHVVFSEDADLTQTPVSGEAVYEWDDGAVQLVSVSREGNGVAGHIPDGAGVYTNGAEQYMHAVSTDGSRILFVAEGKLFLREQAEQEQSELKNGDECTEPEKACTIQVDASQAGGSGGGGTFLAATDDGSLVYFMDDATAKLTSNTVAGSRQNLYEYKVESKELINLTPVSGAHVVGASGFGEAEGSGSSYFYFVAEGALASGAVQGEPNLYLVHNGGAPEFVANLNSPLDTADWTPEQLAVRTSPNGQFVAFDSAHPQDTVNFPSGYENRDENTGQLDQEIYLYGTADHSLYCVSCQPSGAQPQAGGAELMPPSSDAFIAEPGAAYLQRNVLDDGTVFFQTQEALSPQDENETTDVYEYSEGSLSLLSSGAKGESSMFMDASENGENVFIATTQALVGRDTDGALSAYDVRVEGGFPEPRKETPCSGEECRGTAPSGPATTSPESETVFGFGNVKPPIEKKRLTRQQKLRNALKACHKERNKRRRACEAKARKKFGAKAKARRKGSVR